MSGDKIYLTRIEPEANRHRFYKMEVWITLFGEYELVREWGRIGKGGTVRSRVFENKCLALKELRDVAKAKMHRGYRPRNDSKGTWADSGVLQ